MRRLALLLALAAPACAPSRASEVADSLGPEVGDPGPTHRPGQPCLACHSTTSGDGRGEKMFVVAGTIYERASDPRGVANAEVAITDARGDLFEVLTNEEGNFWIAVDEGAGAPEPDGEGGLDVPLAPEFPLRVVVRRGALEQEMRNVVGREGSCAHCHRDPPGADSAGKIFLLEEP